MTLTRRQLLIPACLSVVTGYAAPAFAQSVSALTSCMSRNNDDPACVHEQVGRPFYPYRGFVEGYDHVHPDCLPSEQLAQFQQASNSPCSVTPFSWSQSVDDVWEPWLTLLWGPDQTLRAVYVSGCRRAVNGVDHGYPVGQWGTNDGYWSEWPDPLQVPTYDQFTAGQTIMMTLDWCVANDWMILEFPDHQMQVFADEYGVDPRDALIDLTISYFTDVEPMFEDAHALFGGWITFTAAVRPATMADFNRTGGVDAADVFCFLSAWFSGDARAGACDGVGGCEVADIFAFLSAWFEEAA